MGKTFGQILKCCRNAKGLTQQEFASRMFVSQQSVSDWEQDKKFPQYDKVRDIAIILNLSQNTVMDLIGISEIGGIVMENEKTLDWMEDTSGMEARQVQKKARSSAESIIANVQADSVEVKETATALLEAVILRDVLDPSWNEHNKSDVAAMLMHPGGEEFVDAMFDDLLNREPPKFEVIHHSDFLTMEKSEYLKFDLSSNKLFVLLTDEEYKCYNEEKNRCRLMERNNGLCAVPETETNVDENKEKQFRKKWYPSFLWKRPKRDKSIITMLESYDPLWGRDCPLIMTTQTRQEAEAKRYEAAKNLMLSLPPYYQFRFQTPEIKKRAQSLAIAAIRKQSQE